MMSGAHRSCAVSAQSLDSMSSLLSALEWLDEHMQTVVNIVSTTLLQDNGGMM